MKTKGWGPWKCSWYSLCSKHFNFKDNCTLCLSGEWKNNWIVIIDHLWYKYWYFVWFYWHNRYNSRTNKFLRKHFPNIR